MSCSRIEAMDDFDVRKAALAKTLIEERTQARADLFRAQERVRELEAPMLVWSEAVRLAGRKGVSAVGQAQAMVDQLRADGSCEDAIVDGLVRLAHIEDLLAAWVALPRTGNQSMPVELRALYDAGMAVVEKRKGAAGAKEAERG